ncbi:uncharacterized protein B0P05DRAFT_474221 [Gilbertella persicaria]|nr:uncharacterized protein B0P05DRAFT_474221 [Gilbertella persicaria]KAI8070621.1 hypothetical protein B0P05DRAFT_474221 [Gilbertella persicaria]
MVPLLYATEQEKQKNARLTQAIHKLSQQKHTACKTIKQLKTKLAFCQRQYERETNQLRQKLKINKEEQQDMEQVVDDMQKEMQIMLDELDQTKRQKERFEEKSQRLEKDLQEDSPDHGSQALLRESHTTILQLESDLEQQKEKLEQLLLRTTQERNTMVTTHAQQVDALVLEKNELRARLVQAERSAAELNLLVTVERKKASDKELEDALKRTLAERDAALAKTQQEIMKLKQQADRLSQYNEKQIQREVVARLEELESNLKSTYKKETDTYQLQISREVRELSGRLVELEEELEGMERRQAQYDQQIENIKRSQLNAEEALRAQRLIWEKKEHQLKMEMTKSDQKIISLEKEALVLYSKNLDMARHLGELDLS